MRIALTKGTLRIPPTYFAVQHALALRDRHDFEVFSLLSQVDDPGIAAALTFHEAVGFHSAPLRVREALIPSAFRRMARDIARFAPDVIHQHFANWAQPAVRAATAGDVPLVVTVHGSDVWAGLDVPGGGSPAGLRGQYHRDAIRSALAHARTVLAVSEFLASQVVRTGADARKIHVHYQGIDTDFFTPAPTGQAGSAPPVVLFVGALVSTKGVHDLLTASIELRKRSAHELRIVGDGPLASAVADIAAQHPHISLLGVLDREAVRRQMREAHVLTLPTQGERGRAEAAGLVLLEAQACGTPVVAYASGGTPEMLLPEETGWLVPERDVPALADTLARVLGITGSDYDGVATRARDFVVRHRSLASSARQLDDIYRSL